MVYCNRLFTYKYYHIIYGIGWRAVSPFRDNADDGEEGMCNGCVRSSDSGRARARIARVITWVIHSCAHAHDDQSEFANAANNANGHHADKTVGPIAATQKGPTIYVRPPVVCGCD